VEVSVSNPGSEVTPNQLVRAFDPHFGGGSASRGVGLAVAKQLVERAGGRMHAEAMDAGGMRYVVVLPVAASLALG
jgi:signal transduction histidine kinase